MYSPDQRYFHLSKKIEILEEQMATVLAQLTTLQTSLTDVQKDVATLASGVTSLTATITALQNEIANQGDVLSASTQAVLTQLVAQATTLQTAADAAAAELPPPPTPAP